MTYYRGGVMVYDGNDNLSYILQPEGTVTKTETGYSYNYFKRDHLGSTRAMLSASDGNLQVRQTTDYYPFGLAHSQQNLHLNKRLFSGKELQDASLDGQQLGLYDFGARFYDPAVARWLTQDSMRQFLSPYLYCANNPANLIDPTGMYAIKDSLADGNGGWIYFTTWTEFQGIEVTPGNDGYTPGAPYYPSQFLGQTGGPDYSAGGAADGFGLAGGSGGSAGSQAVGLVSLAYSITYGTRDYSQYTPKKGPNKGVLTSVYKQNKVGNFVLKNGHKIARSANAQAVVNIGKTVKNGSLALNYAGVIISGVDMYTNNINYSNSIDMAFSGMAFIPGVGWMISGSYTMYQTFTPMYIENVFKPYIETTGGAIYPSFMPFP